MSQCRGRKGAELTLGVETDFMLSKGSGLLTRSSVLILITDGRIFLTYVSKIKQIIV